MPSVIHDGDEQTDFPEDPSATENGGTQAPLQHFTTQDYCRRGGKKGGGLRACSQKSFLELYSQDYAFWNKV